MSEYLLEMRGIWKSFSGVPALQGADLRLRAGEVHALVGENGAGKSTLINALGGIYPKDEGQILIDGVEMPITSVVDAQRANISIIHQELSLEPHLSVAENIFINRLPTTKRGFVDYKTMFADAQAAIDNLGLDIRSETIMSRLPLALQQMVEIVKAVSFNARIIVMDEPTSSITDKEVEALFTCIHRLKKAGIGIIYISHRLSELWRIADEVTVMRDGHVVANRRIGDINQDEIVRFMVGREITSYYVRTFKEPGEVLLEVKGVTSKLVHDVSFTLRAGEILGFAGLIGAGRTETMKAILGLDTMISGEVYIYGEKVDLKTPKDAYERGIGYIPENRREEGIIPIQTVQFNLTLKVLKQFIRGIFLNKKKEREIADKYVKLLSIRAASLEMMLQNLSGGNQQKVIISSWLAGNPRILIMDEPTRGIDVGSKAEIYALMNQLVHSGVGIIMISSELPEAINMSDRVAVMREGRISAFIGREQLTQEEVMKYAVNV